MQKVPSARRYERGVWGMDERERALTSDMLPAAQKELAEVIGMECYLDLVRFVNGDSVYFPKYDSLFEGQQRLQRDDEIISKFDGFNFDALAKEYNLTVRSIYNIIPRCLRYTKRNGPVAGQLSFEEYDTA